MKQIATLMMLSMLMFMAKGCNRHTVIIDPSRAHQLVPGQTVQVYVPQGDNAFTVQSVRVEQRWFFKRVDSQ